jgi:hypothetical protein
LQFIKVRAIPRDDLKFSEITHELLVAWGNRSADANAREVSRRTCSALRRC